jgi:TolA-binding protein
LREIFLKRFLIILLLLPCALFAENIYTSGLDTKVLQTNKVRLQWSANIPKGNFLIYRSETGPIKSLSALSNSKLISMVEITGEQDQDLYRFPPYYDKVDKSGDYYYLILPELKQVTLDDLIIGINLTIFPVTVVIPTNALTVKPPEPKVEISGISMLVYNTNRVKLDWLCSVKKQQFVIYRNNIQPVSSPGILNYSKVIAVLEAEGGQVKNNYKMPSYFDRIDEPGDYYYAVLPKKDKYETADFKKSENYNSVPVVIIKPEPVKQPEKKVTNIIIAPQVSDFYIQKINAKKSDSMILLFWELNFIGSQDFMFNLYRSTTPIKNWGQVSGTVPYAQLENEFHFEDYNLKFGAPYYYAVVLQGKNEIVPGKNATVNPLIYDGAEINVPVIKEVVTTNVIKLPVPDKTPLVQPLKNNTVTIDVKTPEKPVKPVIEKKTNMLKIKPAVKTNKVEKIEQDLLSQELDAEMENENIEIVQPLTKTNKNKPKLNHPDEWVTVVDPDKPSVQKKTNVLLITTNLIVHEEYDDDTNYIIPPQPEKTNSIKIIPDKKKPEYFIVTEEFVPAVKTQKKTPITEWANDDFITEVKKPAKAPPTVSVDYFGLGIKYYKKNNYNIAIEYLKKALESADSSNKSVVLFYLGKSYYEMSNYKQALNYFAKLRQYDKKLGDVWMSLTLQRMGEQ